MVKINSFADLKKAIKTACEQECLEMIKKGRFEAAYELLKNISDFSSYNPQQKQIYSESFYQISKSFQNEGNLDKAEACLVKAAQIDKNHPLAATRLETLRKSRRRHSSEFREFQKLAPGQPKAAFDSVKTRIFRGAIKVHCLKDCDYASGESYLHCSECKKFVRKPKTEISVRDGIDDYFALGIYRWKGDAVASENFSVAIRLYKKGNRDLALAFPQLFADAVARRTKFLKSVDIIVSVPSDPVRKKERGFDPPSALGRYISEEFGVPYLESILEKRAAERAKDLTTAEVEATFRSSEKVKTAQLMGRVVLLVDDVATRGSTLSACAKILKRLGVEQVYTAVLAKAETTMRGQSKTMSDLQKLAQWYQLSQSKYLGPVRFRALVEKYGSGIYSVFKRSDEELLEIKGITKQTVEGIRAQADKFEESLAFMESQLSLAQRSGGGILTLDSPEYPEFLKKSSMCHALLYYRGQLSKFINYSKAIAIVGSRNASEQSKMIAMETASDLARRGWVISSGLANGIDASAHKGALKVNGLTIAVLGCGPDVVYPAGSENLNSEIADKGLIISEFPFGTKIDDWRLKKRNKTIVGAALGVFVVETSKKGGAMNAVKGCQEQKKPIFTIEPASGNDDNFSGNAEILSAFKGISVQPKSTATTIVDKMDKIHGLFSL